MCWHLVYLSRIFDFFQVTNSGSLYFMVLRKFKNWESISFWIGWYAAEFKAAYFCRQPTRKAKISFIVQGSFNSMILCDAISKLWSLCRAWSHFLNVVTFLVSWLQSSRFCLSIIVVAAWNNHQYIKIIRTNKNNISFFVNNLKFLLLWFQSTKIDRLISQLFWSGFMIRDNGGVIDLKHKRKKNAKWVQSYFRFWN